MVNGAGVDGGRVLVIGSGPAGVSAARPLVDAGVPVLLLEAGTAFLASPADGRPGLAELRQSTPRAWPHLLGEDLRALRGLQDASPRVRTTVGARGVEEFHRRNRLTAEGFTPVGIVARGGLGNIWGAGVSLFDDRDLAGGPISAVDLADAYHTVVRRIGVSGSQDDDMAAYHGGDLPLDPPLTLSPGLELVLERYRSREHLGLRLGRSRMAVLTRDRASRRACTYDHACMWGCSRRSVYNSALDLAELEQRSHFEVRDGCWVRSVRRDGGVHVVSAVDQRSGEPVVFKAPLVILAAGALGSTRLVLDHLGRYGSERRLLSSPAAAAAWALPACFGRPLPDQAFGMAQLSFRMALPSEPTDDAFGSLFAADAVAASDLMAAMPLTGRGARTFLRALLPMLYLGLVYFPGEYSRNRIWIERRSGDEEPRLRIRGGFNDAFPALLRKTLRKIARDFRRLGLHLLPGSIRPLSPGSEVHYGGSLAMGEMTTRTGEVIGTKNLFVVDGSILARMPAKPPTLTIMANANRIGREIARQWNEASGGISENQNQVRSTCKRDGDSPCSS